RHEIFAQTCIPPEAPFFVRLDGWKFRKVAENVKVEKPFDEKFAKCLVSSGKILYKKGFSPTLIYFASDELNILFLDRAPFRGRIEKIGSILAGLASSTFTLNFLKIFGKDFTVSFDSRIIILTNSEKVIDYLVWRQSNLWRNHNNAYAYWVLRQVGYEPREISKRLKGLKTREIHEIVFERGVNLAKTPLWQRRGILLFKTPIVKKTKNCLTIRWRIQENWDLPLFTERHGINLIKQIMEWTKRKEENSCQHFK
ncbi:MAG: tRNA(His) guanylyltransferase Thg1 family protein, partial [Desulfonauticus sp.]|nr:tRNA(His) guanylyltransferase Thg1 family protein [Desulfonauticus sp.]